MSDNYHIKLVNIPPVGRSAYNLVATQMGSKFNAPFVELQPFDATFLQPGDSVLLRAKRPKEERPDMVVCVQPELMNVSNECVAIEISYADCSPNSAVGHRLLLNPGETTRPVFLHEESGGVIVKVCESDSRPAAGGPPKTLKEAKGEMSEQDLVPMPDPIESVCDCLADAGADLMGNRKQLKNIQDQVDDLDQVLVEDRTYFFHTLGNMVQKIDALSMELEAMLGRSHVLVRMNTRRSP